MEILLFGSGFVLGGILMYIQVRQYRKSLGLRPDPLEEDCLCGKTIGSIHVVTYEKHVADVVENPPKKWGTRVP